MKNEWSGIRKEREQIERKAKENAHNDTLSKGYTCLKVGGEEAGSCASGHGRRRKGIEVNQPDVDLPAEMKRPLWVASLVEQCTELMRASAKTLVQDYEGGTEVAPPSQQLFCHSSNYHSMIRSKDCVNLVSHPVSMSPSRFCASGSVKL